MTGHRPFGELIENFSPERLARVAAKAAALREDMTLEELRNARGLSQEEFAATLAVGQPAAAKPGKRTDMSVSRSAPLRRGPRRNARNHGALLRNKRGYQQDW
jgi:hypothetical protein